MAVCGECGQRVKLAAPQTVAELQAEMAQVDDLMQRLATHRSDLRRRINILAPISRLPPEILLEIFALACQAPSTTPLFFGSICTSWRTLAWNTPTLWSSITLKVTHPHPKSDSQLQLLWEWLLRANNLALNIKLFTTEEDESTFLSFHSIMEVLVTRSMYWGSIECLLPPQCHDILARGDYPLLTKVLFRPPKGTISTFNQPPAMFARAPRLIDADLSGYDFSSMYLPWDQLCKFHTQFLTVAECLKVLSQAPKLAQCYLHNVYLPDNHLFSPALTHSHLIHPTLATLDLMLVKGSGTSLLDAVSLPALKELGLHYGGTENVPLRPVISLVSRSACQLRVLTLSRTIFSEEDLVRCLEAIPTLQELFVCVREVTHVTLGHANGGGLSDEFMARMLGPREGDGRCLFLPKLKVLSYEGPMTCSMNGLLDALEGRWRYFEQMGVSRLGYVSFSSKTMPAMREGEAARAAGLAEEGMQIYVSPCVF